VDQADVGRADFVVHLESGDDTVLEEFDRVDLVVEVHKLEGSQADKAGFVEDILREIKYD
jgi:hypothetical protein